MKSLRIHTCEAQASTHTPRGRDVIALLIRHEGTYILLAVNTAPEAVDAVFVLTDAESVSVVTPLFDHSAPTVDSDAKELRITMPPQSTIAWKITP